MTDYRTTQFVLGIGTETQQVLMSNGRRRSIIFDLSQGGIVRLGNRTLDATAVGVCSTIVNVPLELLYRDHGELITAEWWAFAAGGGQILNVTEVFIV